VSRARVGIAPGAAAVLGLALLAAAVWVHRIEIERPRSHAELLQADAYRYFYPTAVYLHRELREGRIPLWNPYQLAGQPYLALHVPAALYPPSLLLLASLPPLPALAAHAVLHLFVAGLFTWLFAGRLGLSPPARLAAAVAYMLARSLQVGFYMTPFLSTPAWLPALLWASHGLASEATPRWGAALGAALALAFLGGHSQAFVYEVQVAALYGLFALFAVAPAGRRARVVGLAVAAGALAFALAAPQVLPALELARQGVRGLGGLRYEQVALSAVAPAGLLAGVLRALAPASLGAPNALVTLPALALPLALAALFARRQRGHALFLLALAIASGLLLLGHHTRAFELYYRLPAGDLFRVPSRMAFVFAFAAAMLAGIGVEAVAERRPARAPAWLPRAAAAALALAVGADAYARTRTPNALPAASGAFAGAPAEVLEWLRREPVGPRVFVESTGVYSRRVADKLGMMNGVFAVPDYEPSMPRAYLDYFRPSAAEPWHGRLHVAPGRAPERRPYLVSARLLDLMSVGSALIEAPADPEVANQLARASGGRGHRLGDALVFERPGALPRAYAVRRVRAVADRAAAVREIEAADFEPREEAVVTAPAAPGPQAGDAAAGARSAAPAGADRVAIDRYEPHRVVLRARCAARCLAVLTDLDYPGWQASVDGRPARIVATNAIFRGVWLEPGVHEIVYRFAPRSLRAGLALCAAALAVLAAGWLRARRGGRRGP
jgi:hypothetical protein